MITKVTPKIRPRINQKKLNKYTELIKYLQSRGFIILIILLALGSTIDYIGTGFGSNWNVTTLNEREESPTLLNCVADANPAQSGFLVITQCIFVQKVRIILIVILSTISLGVLVGVENVRPFLKILIVYAFLAFTFGGLSWYHSIFQHLVYIMKHKYFVTPVIMLIIISLLITNLREWKKKD